jgi:hypothetical protein
MREYLEAKEKEFIEEENRMKEERKKEWEKACQIVVEQKNRRRMEAESLAHKIELARQEKWKKKDAKLQLHLDLINKFQNDWIDQRQKHTASQMESMERHVMSREDIESRRHDSLYIIKERKKKNKERKEAKRRNQIAVTVEHE